MSIKILIILVIPNFMSNIPSNIKFLRKKKGLTQQEFADQLGIKRSLVGAYEEERADPKYDLLKKIALFFDVSIDDFINEKINENKKLKLVSDNPVYEPYEIEGEDVLEVWKAKAYISTHLPSPPPEPTLESLTSMMTQMQRSIANLQQNN